MSHRHYETEAFVLKSVESGEASRYLYLLTENHGLVIARAQGVRKLAAKHRAHLSTGVHCRVVLVVGREVWHLTGAERLWAVNEPSLPACRLLARLHLLINRLCPRDLIEPEVYHLMRHVYRLVAQPTFNLQLGEPLEVLSVAWLLHYFGYLPRPDWTLSESFAGKWPNNLIKQQNNLCHSINQALKLSHL